MLKAVKSASEVLSFSVFGVSLFWTGFGAGIFLPRFRHTRE